MAVNRHTLQLADSLRIVLNDEIDWTIRQLVQAWVRAWTVIDAEWRLAIDQLVAATEKGSWPTAAEILRAASVQAALASATREVISLADFAGVTVVTSARNVTTETAFWQRRIITSQLPVGYQPGQDLPEKLTDQTLAAIVHRTEEQIESWKRPLPRDMAEQMKRALVRGVAIGESPRATAARMLETTQHEFNGGLTRAMTLARTEVLDAHRSAAQAYQLANPEVLLGWAWTAKLDTRTCAACWAKHGIVHALMEPGPLDHQCGRCARTPITHPWSALGIEIDEPDSLLEDSYEAFRALSREDQLKILGPVRLHALDTDAIYWEQLAQRRTTPGWRDSFVPMSVGFARRKLIRPAR